MRRNHTGLLAHGRSIAGLVALAVVLAGCAGRAEEIGQGPVYPAVTQLRTLDVQVVRDGTRISLTNTTAQPLGPGLLWLNAWYSLPFDGLGIGQRVELNLGDFRDRYGEAFRSGGFFATDAGDVVVLAQLQTTDGPSEPVLLGLVVVHDLTE